MKIKNQRKQWRQSYVNKVNNINKSLNIKSDGRPIPPNKTIKNFNDLCYDKKPICGGKYNCILDSSDSNNSNNGIIITCTCGIKIKMILGTVLNHVDMFYAIEDKHENI
jgi:hypothetical protein